MVLNSGSIVVKSTPSSIVEAWGPILSGLEANNFSEEDIFAVHLAMEEAFLNAVKHGNKMDSSKKVKVDYSASSDKVKISITDEGNGFDPGILPDPRCGENIYKAEGRGVFLIRSYMSAVEFNEQGNCIRMIRYKESQDPAKNKNRGRG